MCRLVYSINNFIRAFWLKTLKVGAAASAFSEGWPTGWHIGRAAKRGYQTGAHKNTDFGMLRIYPPSGG
jgi:hypothetical protein